MSKISEETIMDSLTAVIDPELHIDIVNLGLMQGVKDFSVQAWKRGEIPS